MVFHQDPPPFITSQWTASTLCFKAISRVASIFFQTKNITLLKQAIALKLKWSSFAFRFWSASQPQPTFRVSTRHTQGLVLGPLSFLFCSLGACIRDLLLNLRATVYYRVGGVVKRVQRQKSLPMELSFMQMIYSFDGRVGGMLLDISMRKWKNGMEAPGSQSECW